MVVTGDITQVDLPADRVSGLIEVKEILRGIDGIEFIYFDEKDVVRHRLVQDIVKAYDRYQSMSGGDARSSRTQGSSPVPDSRKGAPSGSPPRDSSGQSH